MTRQDNSHVTSPITRHIGHITTVSQRKKSLQFMKYFAMCYVANQNVADYPTHKMSREHTRRVYQPDHLVLITLRVHVL